MEPPFFSLSSSLVEKYQADGAVLIKGAFSQQWITKLQRGMERNLENPSPFGEFLRAEEGEGVYFDDYCNWQNIDEFKDFAYNSPAASIAAQLMKSQTAVFYHEHVLIKEPGASKKTPWHCDQPYYPINGFQNVSLWVPVDAVDYDVTLEFVRGSHKWDQWFKPRYFASETNYAVTDEEKAQVYLDVPVEQIENNQYEIIKWAAEPGDCVAFHMRTLHGAPGNLNKTRSRRVLSTRWLGDDCTIARRPWKVSPPTLGGLEFGDKAISQEFPLIWQAKGSQNIKFRM